MIITRVTLELSVNTPLSDQSESTLRQIIADIHWPGLVRARVENAGGICLASDLIVTETDSVNAGLLAACETVIDEWHAKDSNFHKKEPDSLKQARAAVAKAKA